MEYFVNLPNNRFHDPGNWAKEMQESGWHGVCASDHFWVNHAYPHVFVAATEMACATDRIKLTTSFCNNLFRSPVEFSQAAISLQQSSGGRFEAGLGAGWLEEELTASGMSYPPPGERVSRYVEALIIAGQLIRNNQCHFKGDFYNIDIDNKNQVGLIDYTAPPLLGSAGGPRAIKEITPLVDRIEINSSARATRGGKIDLGIMATISEDEVKAQIELVKTVREDIPISIFLLVAVGENRGVREMKSNLGKGYLANFMGSPDEVKEALGRLESLGIDRVQLTEFFPDSQKALTPSLLNQEI